MFSACSRFSLDFSPYRFRLSAILLPDINQVALPESNSKHNDWIKEWALCLWLAAWRLLVISQLYAKKHREKTIVSKQLRVYVHDKTSTGHKSRTKDFLPTQWTLSLAYLKLSIRFSKKISCVAPPQNSLGSTLSIGNLNQTSAWERAEGSGLSMVVPVLGTH